MRLLRKALRHILPATKRVVRPRHFYDVNLKKSPDDVRDLAYSVRPAKALPPTGGLPVEKLPPIMDQGNIGSCFPSSQEVLTETLSYKSIKDLTIGEGVITDKGRVRKVTKKFQRIWQGNIHEISTVGTYKTIKATSEHPFLTQRGWVKAQDLSKNDYLCFPFINEVINGQVTSLEKDPDFLWLLTLIVFFY